MTQSISSQNSFNIEPIGFIHSPYAEKFAVPRQPGLAPDALSVIEFYPPYNDELSFIGIDGFSHIHVIFLFDRVEYTSFRPKVRPPRLGGNISVGVFATRSPFRPNRLGLSIVKLNRVIRENGKVKLEVKGADLVDGTPVIDIKPYIPFVDSVPDAKGGFAKEKPKALEVIYQDNLDDYIESFVGPKRLEAITQTLSQDPRPAYKDNEHDTKIYSAKLYNLEIKFTVNLNVVTVIAVNCISGELSC
uniref:tRNA (N6-threonylcarbamoyladenosine(37)-N6)-methyltransferase TrmO n=1 Tax=Succinivibrio sp. TaxID=2053619 RepID=UPI00402A8E39